MDILLKPVRRPEAHRPKLWDSVTFFFVTQALANLINSSLAPIINNHISAGVLSSNGTLTADILIDGDGDFGTMHPLLAHVTAVTGAVFSFIIVQRHE